MANFTPQEINEILAQYFSTVGRVQYVGARYVPIFGRKDETSVAWDNSAPYEPLTIVTYQGNSFISRQYVPAGIEITNEEYWASTGIYNAQIEAYRQETANVKAQYDGLVRSVEILTEEDKKRAFAFDNVTTMKEATSLFAGAFCHTGGFGEVNDGGGAWYVIKEAENDEANGMDIIECSSGLFAYLLFDGVVSLKKLGCTGGTSIDCYPYVIRGAELASSLGVTLLFDAGADYYTDMPILIDKPIDIDMQGRLRFGRINACPIMEPVALTLHGADSRFRSNVLNINIMSTYDVSAETGEIPEDSVGCRIVNAYSCTITLNVSGFHTDVELVGDGAGFAYNAIHIRELQNSFKNLVLRPINDGWVNENQFYDGRFWSTSGSMTYRANDAITLDGINSSHVINANVFDKPAIESSSNGITCINARFNTFNDVRFENDIRNINEDVSCYANSYTAGYQGGRLVLVNSAYDELNLRNMFKAIVFKYNNLVFDSGFIPDQCFSNESSMTWPDYMFTLRGALDSETLTVMPDGRLIGVGTKTNTHVSITNNNYNMCVLVGLPDITYSVTCDYLLKLNGTKQNTKAQWFVVLLDANFVPIDADDAITGSPDDIASVSRTTLINALPCYLFTTNRQYKLLSIKSSDAAYAIFGVRLLEDDITQFQVYEPLAQNSRLLTAASLPNNAMLRGLTTAPTCEGIEGQICPAGRAATGIVGWLKTRTAWVTIYNGTEPSEVQNG